MSKILKSVDPWIHGQCYVNALGGWAPNNHLHVGRCTGPRHHLDQAHVEHMPPPTCDRCGEPLVRTGAV